MQEVGTERERLQIFGVREVERQPQAGREAGVLPLVAVGGAPVDDGRIAPAVSHIGIQHRKAALVAERPGGAEGTLHLVVTHAGKHLRGVQQILGAQAHAHGVAAGALHHAVAEQIEGMRQRRIPPHPVARQSRIGTGQQARHGLPGGFLRREGGRVWAGDIGGGGGHEHPGRGIERHFDHPRPAGPVVVKGQGAAIRRHGHLVGAEGPRSHAVGLARAGTHGVNIIDARLRGIVEHKIAPRLRVG